MIVNNLNSMANVYTSNAVGASRYASSTVGARSVQRNDELSLSKEAQSFSDILKKLRAESDVRQSRVDELEKKISAGTYSVATGDIATSLILNRY